MRSREIECCKCKWKDIQLFSGSFRREIQLDGNINKDKQKVRCQEVGQGRDKDVKWRLRWRCTKTFSINSRNQKIARIKKWKMSKFINLSYLVGFPSEWELWYL